jgi:hypothetical protein
MMRMCNVIITIGEECMYEYQGTSIRANEVEPSTGVGVAVAATGAARFAVAADAILLFIIFNIHII